MCVCVLYIIRHSLHLYPQLRQVLWPTSGYLFFAHDQDHATLNRNLYLCVCVCVRVSMYKCVHCASCVSSESEPVEQGSSVVLTLIVVCVPEIKCRGSASNCEWRRRLLIQMHFNSHYSPRSLTRGNPGWHGACEWSPTLGVSKHEGGHCSFHAIPLRERIQSLESLVAVEIIINAALQNDA